MVSKHTVMAPSAVERRGERYADVIQGTSSLSLGNAAKCCLREAIGAFAAQVFYAKFAVER
jgi:hypothetical protein